MNIHHVACLFSIFKRSATVATVATVSFALTSNPKINA